MTNEVLQKTASDEQNVSSSNGLEPSIRFKNFTKKWNKISLKEIGTFQKGAPLSKADISQEGNPFILYGELYTTYSEVTYKVFRKTDKKVDKIYFSNVGDVILPTSGETPEEIAIATCIMIPDVILAGDLYIFRQNKIDGRILSYIINHTVNGKISRIAQGKSVVHVRSEELGKIIINYPTNDEQEKIANFLSLIDQRIEKQRQLVESLKKYKRGYFQRIISSLETSSFELKNIVDEYNAKSKIQNELPILSSTLSGIKLQNDYFNKQAASETTIGYKIVPFGYFTYRSMSDTGEFRFNLQNIIEKGIVSPAYPVFKVKEEYNAEFVEYILNETDKIKSQLLVKKEGGTRYALSFSKFQTLKIDLPTKSVQDKMVSQLRYANKILTNEEGVLSNLQKLKNGLLQQMFI